MEEVFDLVSFWRDENGNLRIYKVFDDVKGDVMGDVFGDVRGKVHGKLLNK